MRIVMLLAAPVLFVLAPLGALIPSGSSDAQWFEVLDQRLVVASGDESEINRAVEEALRKFRMSVETQEELFTECEFDMKFNAWFEQNETGMPLEQTARRLVHEQLDENGQRLKINQISNGKRTLVLIDHEAPREESEVAQYVALRLMKAGFEKR